MRFSLSNRLNRWVSNDLGRRGRSCLFVVACVLCLGCGESLAPVEFGGDAAWKYLLKQCYFGTREPGSAGHDSVTVWIARRLEASGAEVSLQRFEMQDPYGDRRMKLTNIIGSYAPRRERRVLLAAHFDTRPWADQEPVDSLRNRPIIGANDGASGVAVLLEIADLLQQQLPKAIGVDLVFFDGEDYGKPDDYAHYLLGSKYFAANLGGYRPECGVLLDMVGATDAEIRKEGNSVRLAPRVIDELFERAKRLELGVFIPEVNQSIYDDHVPLLQAGIPMVDLIGLPYPYWHTLGDTPDKCSKETLRQVGTLLVDFIYDFHL